MSERNHRPTATAVIVARITIKRRRPISWHLGVDRRQLLRPRPQYAVAAKAAANRRDVIGRRQWRDLSEMYSRRRQLSVKPPSFGVTRHLPASAVGAINLAAIAVPESARNKRPAKQSHHLNK